MFEALWTGFLLVFQWPAILFLALGVFLGIWLGAVPGLGGLIGMVLLLPFTYGMDPVSAFALLLGMYAVTATSDTIASVMLGIPGTAASQATILDGYPLAQQGQADRAFGAAFTVSAFGGVFGAFVLAISLPIFLPIIMAFGSPEFFMLGLLGIAMVGSLAGGSVLKGLTVGGIGIMVAMIGYSPVVAEPRFWFGADYLIDGVQLIPIVLGLFAVPELMELAVKDTSISKIPKDQAADGGLARGIRDAAIHWWLALRCAVIGVYVGMLPGLGAPIVDWLAYGHAVQSAKDKSRFGQGDIRGVIAPESANNAMRGGTLIPTVTFGIPGSASMAVLLGALQIQGLKPGQDMLTDNLHITFSMVWTLVVANILVAVLLMFWSRQVAKVAFVRGHLIVPGVIVFVFMGAWLGASEMGDWFALIIFGMIGYVMKRGGWARPPMVLGLVLGGIMEINFQRSVGAFGWFGWFDRPIVIVLILCVVATIYLAVRGIIKTKRTPGAVVMGEGAERNPIISLPLTLFLLGMFILSAVTLFDIPAPASYMPAVTIAPAILFLLFILRRDGLELREAMGKQGGLGAVWRATVAESRLGRVAEFFAWLLAITVVSELVGQLIALPLYVLLYLWRWGGYGWKVSVGYAAVMFVLLWGFYDQVINVLWHPSLLFG